MGLFEELKKMQALSPKERVMNSLENRRGKTDSWIRNLQIHTIARDVIEYGLTPENLEGATEEEKKEMAEIIAGWTSEKRREANH